MENSTRAVVSKGLFLVLVHFDCLKSERERTRHGICAKGPYFFSLPSPQHLCIFISNTTFIVASSRVSHSISYVRPTYVNQATAPSQYGSSAAIRYTYDKSPRSLKCDHTLLAIPGWTNPSTDRELKEGKQGFGHNICRYKAIWISVIRVPVKPANIRRKELRQAATVSS